VNPFAVPAEIYAAALVFMRVGAIIMLIPGIGETAIPPRVRLSLALLIALCLGAIAKPTLPAIPDTLGVMGAQVIKELLIGLMIGGLVRLFMSSLAVVGETVAIQTTLAFSQTANPMQAQPGTSISAFLGVLGVTLIFATNLHHVFIGAIAHSYTIFAPSKPILVQDAALLAIQTVGRSFALGIQLAAPVIVFSLVFNVAVGLVGRVMPQFQIFFVASPLSVILGLSVFALSLGTLGLIWIERYEDFLQIFV
jgi:flagellar biosynthesis protein FliR